MFSYIMSRSRAVMSSVTVETRIVLLDDDDVCVCVEKCFLDLIIKL
jgi:hypothetical protein